MVTVPLILLLSLSITALFLQARKKYGFYLWYFIILILAAIGILTTISDETIHHLYFCVFLLGILTAFAEIISTFSDEPLKALQTPHALIYHLANGLIAVLGLYVLEVSKFPHGTPLNRVNMVLAAGFGSMIIIRSKLLNIKIGSENVSLGPEQVVKVFFRFMETAIDRVRARSRIDFVKGLMRDIDFDMVQEYSLSMLLAAPLTLDEKARKDCVDGILELKNNSIKDKQLKSYHLGFLLLNQMGEDFLNTLFEKPETSWLIRAPIPERRDNTILERFVKLFSSGDEIPYVVYGASMSREVFRQRMGWSDVEETYFSELVRPQKCLLKGYRLVFNKPIADAPGHGEANIEQDENETVEGVLYAIPKISIDFLDRSAGGYIRKQVSVFVNGSQIEAQIFVAETTQDGLTPSKEYMESILNGAKQHDLSLEYQRNLEKYKALTI
jgi:hypothetical protein